MRTVTREAGNFVVESDPDRAIAHLLSYAVTDREREPAAFESEGDGYFIDGVIAAYRVRSDEDVPAGYEGEIPTDGEVWVIEKEVPRVGIDVAWLRGDELRSLLAQAKRLQQGS